MLHLLIYHLVKSKFDLILDYFINYLTHRNRMIYLQIAAFTSRCKYYVAWFLSEAACVLCGFGFNGYNASGNARWDRFTNIIVRKCELSQSIKEMIDHWNIGANRWLRYYVYMRITPPGQTGGSLSASATYAVSALWHGFYPGYYRKCINFLETVIYLKFIQCSFCQLHLSKCWLVIFAEHFVL